jgi:hypothetical protein
MADINNKKRDEFEAWARKMSMDLEYRNIPGVGQFYECPRTLLALEAWQASREALVIELPDDGIEDCRKEWPERGEKYSYDTFDTGYLYACKKHEQAIEAAGLKVSQ